MRTIIVPGVALLLGILLAGCAEQTAPPPGAAAGSAKASKPPNANVKVRPVSPDEFKKLIAEQKGKVVLVDFWATYCGPCRERFPQTLALGKKYADRGLVVVSMSMDAPDADVQQKVLQFLQDQDSEITNLSNRLEDTDTTFGALDIDGGALPHYKVFDRKGKLSKKFGGDPDHPFAEKDIETAVVAALNAK